jgi:lipopolysaccharide export LptBFGC system permease protein LptF
LRLIDRYLFRAVIPPFLIALGVFTFLMAVNPMLEYAQRLIAKGVALPTVGICC